MYFVRTSDLYDTKDTNDAYRICSSGRNYIYCEETTVDNILIQLVVCTWYVCNSGNIGINGNNSNNKNNINNNS